MGKSSNYRQKKVIKRSSTDQRLNPSQDNLSKYEQAKQILYEMYDRVQENYLQTNIDAIYTAVVNKKSW